MQRKLRGRRWRRRIWAGTLIVAVLPGALLMLADELVRSVTRTRIESPVALPPGVEIREAPRLTRLIGAPSGGAAAVTIGRTILVPHVRVMSRTRARDSIMLLRGDTLLVSPSAWRELMEHERVHVRQRNRYGRLYLPIYLMWYLQHGYLHHPLEREARLLAGVI